MTDRAQFEAMLEALVNEDHAAAKEIFHNIVVAKSREIYEELLAEDFDLAEAEEEEEECDESSNPFASSEEGEEEEGEEEESEEEEEGDASDDMADDSEEDSFDDSGEGEGELEDRVLDLENALDELQAEFDSLMADEANEPEHNDGVDDPDFGADDEFGGDEFGADDSEEDDAFAMGDDDSEVKEVHHYIHDESSASDREFQEFMEYVNKVALPKHGDNGANAKSIVASKNDMGGTSANILRTDTSTTGGTQGGLLNPSTQEENFGNINVPGGKAGKTGFTHREPGHGAEKKGKGESAPNKKSIIGSSK